MTAPATFVCTATIDYPDLSTPTGSVTFTPTSRTTTAGVVVPAASRTATITNGQVVQTLVAGVAYYVQENPGGSPVGTVYTLPSQAASATTTVAAGSNGVNVTTFAGAGVLNVASSASFSSGGGFVTVPISGGNTAIVSYTGTGTGTLTGCTLVSPSAGGTLSTGGTVTSAVDLSTVSVTNGLVIPAGAWAGAWNSTTVYEPNQITSYGGTAWIALTPNVGVTPVAGATWAVFVGLPSALAAMLPAIADYYVVGGGTSTYTAYNSAFQVVATSSTPDLGPILNTLFAALISGGVGGTIRFGPGKFIIQPNWQTDASGIGYVCGIPYVAQNWSTIRLIGDVVGAITQIYTGDSAVSTGALAATGTQFFFNISAAPPDTYSSMLRVISAAGNTLSNTSLYIDGIRFTQASNAYNYTMVDGYAAANLSVGTVAADTYTTNASQIPQPATHNTAFSFPQVNGQGPYTAGWVMAAGYGNGAQFSEHLVAQAIYTQACVTGLNPNAASESHGSIIQKALVQECTYVIYQGSSCTLSIEMLDLESVTGLTGTNAWQNFVAMFGAGATPEVYGDIHVTKTAGTSSFGTIPTGVRLSWAGNQIGPATITTSTYTLNPLNGAVQELTLSPPAVSGLAYESNTVVITPTTGSIFAVDVTLLNDTSIRNFVFRNVTWVDNVPTPGGAAGGVNWSGRLWSPDGVTVFGRAGQNQEQGLDPISVPAIAGAWEAALEPFAPGTTNAAMLARTGTAMTADTAVQSSAVLPTLKAPYTSTAPLQPWERGYLPRAAFDCSAANSAPEVAFVSGGATAGFTIILACYLYTGAESHDQMIVELGNGSANVLGLVVPGSGGGGAYWYYANGSFDNWSAPNPIVASSLTPAVISIIQPPASGSLVCRVNGVAATFGALSITGATDTLRIAHSVKGTSTFSNNPSGFAGIWAFTEGLPFAQASDPVQQIERRAYARVGIAA